MGGIDPPLPLELGGVGVVVLNSRAPRVTPPHTSHEHERCGGVPRQAFQGLGTCTTHDRLNLNTTPTIDEGDRQRQTPHLCLSSSAAGTLTSTLSPIHSGRRACYFGTNGVSQWQEKENGRRICDKVQFSPTKKATEKTRAGGKRESASTALMRP